MQSRQEREAHHRLFGLAVAAGRSLSRVNGEAEAVDQYFVVPPASASSILPRANVLVPDRRSRRQGALPTL